MNDPRALADALARQARAGHPGVFDAATRCTLDPDVPLDELPEPLSSSDVGSASLGSALPARRERQALARLVRDIVHQAYRITDEDIAGLLALGMTERQVYEAVVAGAVAAGTARLERGLQALEEALG